MTTPLLRRAGAIASEIARTAQAQAVRAAPKSFLLIASRGEVFLIDLGAREGDGIRTVAFPCGIVGPRS